MDSSADNTTRPRRHRLRWLLALLAVAVISAGGLWFWEHYFKPEARARRLVAALRADGSNTEEITQSLLRLGSPAVPALIDVVKDPGRSSMVRAEAVRALGGMGRAGQAGVPVLAELLEDKLSLLRYAAALSLGSSGAVAAPAVPALRKAAKDADAMLRWYAVAALGRIGPAAAAAVPDLESATNDSNVTVRCHAMAALIKLGRPGGRMAVLMDMLRSEDPATSREGVLAMSYLGREAAPAVGALCDRLRKQSNDHNCIRALGEIGPAAAESLPLLRAIAVPGELENKTAKEAIRKIEGTPGN